MFRIADGRETFYQWDLDRQIIVDDPSIKEVHFCNRTDDCSLVVEVEDLEIFADYKPISVLRTANVPNVLLQSSFDIRVFGYDGKATLHDEKFKVKARTKPSDYVYTEVEISRYEDLSKRIDEIEAEGVSQEAVDNAVNRYLAENPIGDIPTKVSELENDAGYATETYVDNAISNIPEVDLSKHALKSEVPTKVSQLQNDSNFITREEVPETDLSEYAKKSEIPNVSDFITSIPSEYITESELNAKGYSTFSGRYSDLIGKPDIPSVDGLAPVTYVDQKFNSIDLAPYAIKAEVAQTYAKKSDIPKDYLKEVPAEYVTENELAAKDYASKGYVQTELRNIDIPESKDTIVLDVTEATSSETTAPEAAIEFANAFVNGEYNDRAIVVLHEGSTYPVTVSTSNNVVRLRRADSVSSDGFVYKNEYTIMLGSGKWSASSAGFYLAKKAALDNYYTKTEVDEAIANIDIPEGGDTDLSNYYTKAETYSKTETYSKAEVDNAIANIDIPEADPVDLSNYYTKTETYNKTEVDAAIAAVGTGGGGGSGGSNVKVFTFEHTSLNTMTAEEIEVARYVASYMRENKKAPEDYILFVQKIQHSSYFEIAPVIKISITWYGTDSYNVTFYYKPDVASTSVGLHMLSFKFSQADDTLLNAYGGTAETDELVSASDIPTGGSDWTMTTDYSDYNLYNAREIFILFEASDYSSRCMGSYIHFGEHTLGDGWTYKNFYIAHPDNNVDYWFYDGSQICGPSNFPPSRIMYKT